ncbi:MAG: ROK family protein [Dehalococcoidia bacterium]|nr:ROK family protein [Dehalococcoidia bacterium]
MPQHFFIAGVDIGATNVRVAIANSDGGIEARRLMPFPGGPPEQLLERIGRTLDDLARGVWVGARAAAIGVVVPGAVDPAAGAVSTAANLPGWGDVPVEALLGRPRGVPVATENDANAAAIGERWLGAAKGIDDFVFIAMGTGIGAGVVVDGRLHRGGHFLAGEVAFFPMSPAQLEQPGWGHCFEADVGGRAMAAKAVELLGDHATVGELFDAAYRGRETAAAWLHSVQRELAMAVVSIAALLDPQMVVFGGGVVRAQGERLLGPVRDAALRCLPARPRIVASQLGDDAQLIGAIRIALDRIEGRPQ